MNPFKDPRLSLESIFNSTPNLYWQVPQEIKTAIYEEIKSYNFTNDKQEYIIAKIEGSIAGSNIFDSRFKDALEAAPDAAARKAIIRSYLRAYIKREVDIEIANIQKEVRNNIVSKKGGVFGIFDPRWKKKVNPGDYTQYTEYRDAVTNYLFPSADATSKAEGAENITSATTTTSEHYKYLQKQVQDYNDGKLVIPAGVTPQDYFNQLSQDAFAASNQTFVHKETGRVLNTEDLMILTNIESSIGKEIKGNLSPEQKIKLLDDVKVGNVDSASKNYIKRFELFGKVSTEAPQNVFKELVTKGKTAGKTASEFTNSLAGEVPRIVIDSAGNAVLKGKDIFHDISKNSISEFNKGLKSNSKKAIQELQHQSIGSNISTIKLLIHKGSAHVTELTNVLQQNELIHDIVSFTKASKSFTSFSTKNTAEATRLQNRILTAVSSGTLKFKSDIEKNDFIYAIQNEDHLYLNKFTTPGMFGKSTFSQWLSDLNDSTLEVAGLVGSDELTTRALNFNNYTSMYKRSVLNNLIYAAQLGYDSGYFVHEIKNRLKETQVGKLWTQFDTKVTWDSVKKKVRNGFLDIATKNYFGKAANRQDIETLLDLYSGKTSFSKLLSRSARYRFENMLLKRFGVSMNLDFKWTLKDIMKSRLFQLAKLKLLKNLRFLEKGLGLAFKKLTGPLSRVLGRGWSFASRGLGRFFGSFSWIIDSALKKIGIKGGFVAELARTLVAGCLFIFIFYVAFVLSVMQIILPGFSSLSSTRYDVNSELDQNYGAARPLSSQGNIIASGVFAFGNVCVSPEGAGLFADQAYRADWNNLNLSDFEGTRNDANCRIMCNAKNVMGALFTSNDGNVNCSGLKTMSVAAFENKFVCTDLVRGAYEDDDPGLVSRSVIEQDRYLKSKSSGPGALYEKIDLAEPNVYDPLSAVSIMQLDEYKPYCVPLEKFAPGNIFILRRNTCNETGGAYYTINPDYGNVVSLTGAHVEMVLKVADEGGKKYLYTISSNHIRKKIKYTLTQCSGNTYKLSSKDQKAPGFREDQLLDSFPCRMYELVNPNPALTCPTDSAGNDACIVGPNNYPDFQNYTPVPISETRVSTPF